MTLNATQNKIQEQIPGDKTSSTKGRLYGKNFSSKSGVVQKVPDAMTGGSPVVVRNTTITSTSQQLNSNQKIPPKDEQEHVSEFGGHKLIFGSMDDKQLFNSLDESAKKNFCSSLDCAENAVHGKKAGKLAKFPGKDEIHLLMSDESGADTTFKFTHDPLANKGGDSITFGGNCKNFLENCKKNVVPNGFLRFAEKLGILRSEVTYTPNQLNRNLNQRTQSLEIPKNSALIELEKAGEAKKLRELESNKRPEIPIKENSVTKLLRGIELNEFHKGHDYQEKLFELNKQQKNYNSSEEIHSKNKVYQSKPSNPNSPNLTNSTSPNSDSDDD